MKDGALVIACGALARELVELKRRNRWEHLSIRCLPASLHNRPAQIPARVAEALAEFRDEYRHIFVAYADCGTGGRLDRVLAEYGVERLPGAHCYQFFTGDAAFAALCDEEPGTFYLTDFLVRHFERLVTRSLKLDSHPELRDQYFGNYRRLVYLVQSRNAELSARAREHAAFLGLDYEEHYTGLETVASDLKEQAIRWQN